jgi:membrane protease YdiL (CAAX protease family)
VILPLLLVYGVTRAFWWVTDQPAMLSWPDWAEGGLKLALWVPTAVLGIMWLRGRRLGEAIEELGLTVPAAGGVGLLLTVTLPMAMLPALAGIGIVRPGAVLSATLLGPIAEEVLYRGFFFQQLVLRARWPVWVAALASGFAFGIAHYQNLDVTLALGLLQNDLGALTALIGPGLMSTTLGGCLFAWLVWRWRSLWPAIALHGGINFWWELAPSASGLPLAGIAQTATIGLAIAATVRRGRTSGPGASSPEASRPAR